MLTKNKVLDDVKLKKFETGAIDGRDFKRLCDYFGPEEWKWFGFSLKEDADLSQFKQKEWTEDNFKESLRGDLEFAFEKALGKRGLSAGAMYSVVKMWLRILEDQLYYDEEYAQYGLPLFKKVALKYGFPNEIGEDYGNEFKYSAEADM